MGLVDVGTQKTFALVPLPKGVPAHLARETSNLALGAAGDAAYVTYVSRARGGPEPFTGGALRVPLPLTDEQRRRVRGEGR